MQFVFITNIRRALLQTHWPRTINRKYNNLSNDDPDDVTAAISVQFIIGVHTTRIHFCKGPNVAIP